MLRSEGAESPKFTHTMATVVYTYGMRKRTRQLFDLQNVVQKLHDVHRTAGNGARMVVSLEQVGIIAAHVGGAGCRRGHDIVEAFEHLLELVGQGLSHILESGIAHRLSTSMSASPDSRRRYRNVSGVYR